MFTGKRIRVILNPGSGTGQARELSDRIDRFIRARGPAELELLVTGGPDDAVTWATEAANQEVEIVIAAGGDGTVTSVAHGILQAETRPAIGIIPLGTGNGLARVLGIPVDTQNAISTMAVGKMMRLDAIDVPSHNATSLLFLGAGLDAEINRDADGDHKSRLGFLAYIQATFANLAGRKNHTVKLVVDGEERNLEAHTISVFNATRMQLLGGHVGPAAHPHDGVAELFIMSAPGVMPVVGQLLRVVSGPTGKPQMEAIRTLELESDPPMLVHIDGDVVGQTPVSARVLPGALRFVVPANYKVTSSQVKSV